MPDLSKRTKAAHEVKARYDEMSVSASVNDSGEARISATLCLTISEQFAAVLHLVEGGFSTQALVIVRSMLEGLASLLNLIKNPNYLDQIKFDNARADIALFEECAADPVIRKDDADFVALKASKDKAQPIVDELKAKGVKQQNIFEQFKQAGMANNYVAYRILYSYGHNQLSTLLERHATVNFELRYHHPAPEESIESTLTGALSILCRAMETLPKFTNLAAPDVMRVIDAADVTWSKAQSIG